MGTDFIGAGRYNYNTKGSVEAVTLPLGSVKTVTLPPGVVVDEADLRPEWRTRYNYDDSGRLYRDRRRPATSYL